MFGSGDSIYITENVAFFLLLLLKTNLANVRNINYSFSHGVGVGAAKLRRFIMEARTSGSSRCRFYLFCFNHFLLFFFFKFLLF